METLDPVCRFRRMRYLMGCLVEIETTAHPRGRAEEAVEAAFFEMRRIENLISIFKGASILSKVNQQASHIPVEVPDEVFALLENTLSLSDLTEGHFDPTTLPLTELWKRAAKRAELPTPRDIREALAKVGHGQVELDRRRHAVYFHRRGMKMDLGALGKGCAVDKAIQVLRKHEIHEALVTTGSTVFSLGDEITHFGVTHPLRPDEIMTAVELRNNSVSTSASYERFLKISGKKYGHMINPFSGFPVGGNVLSVSVISDSALRADALSTALFVSGFRKAASLLEKFPGAEAVVIAKKRFRILPEVVRLRAGTETMPRRDRRL